MQAQCNNTNGSYTCQCGQGWSGDGNTCQGKLKVNFNCVMGKFTYSLDLYLGMGQRCFSTCSVSRNVKTLHDAKSLQN